MDKAKVQTGHETIIMPEEAAPLPPSDLPIVLRHVSMRKIVDITMSVEHIISSRSSDIDEYVATISDERTGKPVTRGYDTTPKKAMRAAFNGYLRACP